MIEYKGLPIFGDDSNPRNTSKFLGFIGTFIVWFIFLLCMIIIRPAEKEQRKYKDVQIVFESLPPLPEPPPIPEPIIEEPEPIVEPIEIEEVVVEVPEVKEEKQVIPEKKNPKPLEKKPEKKKDLSKKDSDIKTKTPVSEKKEEIIKNEESSVKDSKKEGYVLQKDMTNPVFPEKVESKPSFDWSFFDDELPVNENSQSKEKVTVNKKNEVSGTAGRVVDDNLKNNNMKSSEVVSNINKGTTVASDKTKGALGGVRNAKTVTLTGDGGNSEITFKGGDDNGGYFMSMGGGGGSDAEGRGIISPREPFIELSDEVISEIDVSKSVIVSFTVLPNGNVVEIAISPAASLPPSVVQEIKAQVGSWRFESASYRSQGEFKYNIKLN